MRGDPIRGPEADLRATQVGFWVSADRAAPSAKEGEVADLRPKRISEFVKQFRVEPGRKVRLPHDFPPDAGTGRASKKEAKEILAQGVSLLAEYQSRLAAQDTQGVVMVLQAMDAAGKDGTIRHVMSGVNPQGVRGQQLQDPVLDRARPRLPLAIRAQAAVAWPHRDLQPLVLRRGPRRPRPSGHPRRPAHAVEVEGPGDLEPPVPRDQRLGAIPHRPGLHLRQALPEPQPTRSSAGASWRASTSPRRTGSSRPTTPVSGRTGATTRRPSATSSARPVPTGRPGT